MLIRETLVDHLQSAGFITKEAANAAEAIQVLENDSDIKIVITDIQMPGSMDGIALAHYVRRRWPPTKIVIASGNRRPSVDQLPVGADFIAKPFAAHELNRVFHNLRA